jgi:hypothetical protein
MHKAFLFGGSGPFLQLNIHNGYIIHGSLGWISVTAWEVLIRASEGADALKTIHNYV